MCIFPLSSRLCHITRMSTLPYYKDVNLTILQGCQPYLLILIRSHASAFLGWSWYLPRMWAESLNSTTKCLVPPVRVLYIKMSLSNPGIYISFTYLDPTWANIVLAHLAMTFSPFPLSLCVYNIWLTFYFRCLLDPS
jgi:hypothetical protein